MPCLHYILTPTHCNFQFFLKLAESFKIKRAIRGSIQSILRNKSAEMRFFRSSKNQGKPRKNQISSYLKTKFLGHLQLKSCHTRFLKLLLVIDILSWVCFAPHVRLKMKLFLLALMLKVAQSCTDVQESYLLFSHQDKYLAHELLTDLNGLTNNQR